VEFCVLEFCAIVMQLIGLIVESGIGNGSSENAIVGPLVTPFLVHFFTTIGVFYTAVIVVRLCMDKACFCVALSLGTPVYVTGIIVIVCFSVP
jgi:hypothetical protein